MTSIITDQIRDKVSAPVILGLLLCLVVPLLWTFIISPLVEIHMVINELHWWILSFAVIAIVLFWERLPLSSVGVHGLTWKDGLLVLLLGALVFVLLPILSILVALVIGGSENSLTVLNDVAKQSLLFRILIALRAAVTEEILFRAYPIERMKSLTGKIWIGAIVSLVIFSILHLGWGWAHVIAVFITGLIFAYLYIWKRNLILNILVHFFPDFIFVLIAPFIPPSPF